MEMEVAHEKKKWLVLAGMPRIPRGDISNFILLNYLKGIFIVYWRLRDIENNFNISFTGIFVEKYRILFLVIIIIILDIVVLDVLVFIVRMDILEFIFRYLKILFFDKIILPPC